MDNDLLEEAMVWASNAPYSSNCKDAWKRAGRRVLRQLAKDLSLSGGTYKVRVHEGGPAVSGDCILHSDKLYVCLTHSLSGCDDAGYARRVKSRADYQGERNISIPKKYEGLLRIARQIVDESLPSSQIEGSCEFRP